MTLDRLSVSFTFRPFYSWEQPKLHTEYDVELASNPLIFLTKVLRIYTPKYSNTVKVHQNNVRLKYTYCISFCSWILTIKMLFWLFQYRILQLLQEFLFSLYRMRSHLLLAVLLQLTFFEYFINVMPDYSHTVRNMLC